MKKTRRNHSAAFKAKVAMENDFLSGALGKAGMLSARK